MAAQLQYFYVRTWKEGISVIIFPFFIVYFSCLVMCQQTQVKSCTQPDVRIFTPPDAPVPELGAFVLSMDDLQWSVELTRVSCFLVLRFTIHLRRFILQSMLVLLSLSVLRRNLFGSTEFAKNTSDSTLKGKCLPRGRFHDFVPFLVSFFPSRLLWLCIMVSWLRSSSVDAEQRS